MKTFFVVVLLLIWGCPAPGQPQTTWDGFVTDTHCGTNCQRTSTMTPDRACVRRCVTQGSKYGLWYKDQVYPLEPQAQAAKFAAENVRVTGEFANGIIHIRSITRVPVKKTEGTR